MTFGYLFTLYFILGGAETMMSPLFPLVEPDLNITESNLAAILASVSAGIATFNILGGISSRWLSDRWMVRASAVALAAGMVLSAAAQTFWVLLIGQTLLGVAFGIYFPPGLASVARLYRGAEGKAIAVWGQAYSFGLAAAALSVFAGENWRWVFVGCAVPPLLAIAYVPRWVEADRGPAPEPCWPSSSSTPASRPTGWPAMPARRGVDALRGDRLLAGVLREPGRGPAAGGSAAGRRPLLVGPGQAGGRRAVRPAGRGHGRPG